MKGIPGLSKDACLGESRRLGPWLIDAKNSSVDPLRRDLDWVTFVGSVSVGVEVPDIARCLRQTKKHLTDTLASKWHSG